MPKVTQHMNGRHELRLRHAGSQVLTPNSGSTGPSAFPGRGYCCQLPSSPSHYKGGWDPTPHRGGDWGAGLSLGGGPPVRGLRSLAVLQVEHHGRRLSELHEVSDVCFQFLHICEYSGNTPGGSPGLCRVGGAGCCLEVVRVGCIPRVGTGTSARSRSTCPARVFWVGGPQQCPPRSKEPPWGRHFTRIRDGPAPLTKGGGLSPSH